MISTNQNSTSTNKTPDSEKILDKELIQGPIYQI